MSSVVTRRVMIAAVAVAMSSFSRGPPRDRIKLFDNWTASDGKCTVSSVTGWIIRVANLGDRVLTIAWAIGGDMSMIASKNSSTIAVSTGSEV